MSFFEPNAKQTDISGYPLAFIQLIKSHSPYINFLHALQECKFSKAHEKSRHVGFAGVKCFVDKTGH